MADLWATEHFGPDARDVPKARRFVLSVVEDCGVDPDDAALVVSELAGNAVLHARSRFTVTVSCDDGRTLIEVEDEDPMAPGPGTAAVTGLSGRGLRLVAALASAWGVRSRPDDGKTVWAELRQR